MFGLFDGDGWAWATTKAAFWLLVIILTLGYIPDRAYYFIVSRTMDIGILGWSPVNLCPPENSATIPCPVPVGGVLPWQASPVEAALPAPRTGGVAAQVGKNVLYVGGSDGTAASATTYVATLDKGKRLARQVYLVEAGWAYVLTLVSETAQAASRGKDFDEVLSSKGRRSR